MMSRIVGGDSAQRSRAVRDYPHGGFEDAEARPREQQTQRKPPMPAASAHAALQDFSGTLVIVNGDMPMVTAEVISEVIKAQARTGLALLACNFADPAQYGRVLMTPDGFLSRIDEYKVCIQIRAPRHHAVQWRLLCFADARRNSSAGRRLVSRTTMPKRNIT